MHSPGAKSLAFRCLALFLQAIVTFVMYNEKYFNVWASLSVKKYADDDAFKAAYFLMDYNYSWLLASSLIVNAVEFLTMLLGHPSGSAQFNMLGGLLHLIAFSIVCYMLSQPWRIQAFFYVFVVCSVLPMVASSLFAVDRIVLRSSFLRRIDIRI